MFVLLLALLSTAIAYRFGVGHQEEHIPIILRQLDPNYLTNDFFVSTSVEFGPRMYFARLVALIAQVISLPWAFVALRFLSDLGLALVTRWAALGVIGTDRLGARIAAVLTLTVSSFHLGDATDLRVGVFQPAALGVPGMLFAIGLGLCGRPLAAAVVASATSLPHPLYGAYGGALGLAAAFFARLPPGLASAAGTGQSERPGAFAWRGATVRTGAGITIFVASMLVFWWWPAPPEQADRLSTEELFAILGRFRSPHHYLPSAFRLQDYVETAAFVFAVGLAFERWSRGVSRQRSRLVLIPLIGVAVACTAGTVFTEVWPVKAVLMVQPFRILGVLKWVGFLLLGWQLASYWQRPPNAIARPVVGLSMISPGGAHPLVTAAGLAIARFQPWFVTRIRQAFWVVVIAIGAAALWLQVNAVDEQVRLLVAVALLTVLSQTSRQIRRVGAAMAMVFIVGIASNRLGGTGETLSPLKPVFFAEDLPGPAADTARAAAVVTDQNSLFVAPPDFGILRIVGRRALVVEFEAIPFQDAHMREWRERIRRVYGDVGTTGHDARNELNDAYRRMTDSQLRDLAMRYGATHAILYTETSTAMPEVYANRRYRIVHLEDP
ncbi:MAG: DUF6798 domain-containing protein [Acidobacteriota bacterium]